MTKQELIKKIEALDELEKKIEAQKNAIRDIASNKIFYGWDPSRVYHVTTSRATREALSALISVDMAKSIEERDKLRAEIGVTEEGA